MAEHVRCDPLLFQRRALPFGNSLVAGDQSLDGIPAQRPAATARECRRRRQSGTLSEPFRQDCDHFLPERSAAFLPAFALAAEVRTCAEDDIVTPQANQLRVMQIALRNAIVGRMDRAGT